MIDDEEGMNNALEYYREQEKLTHYWGDWTTNEVSTDEDPYSAEEMEEEEQDYWEGYEYDDDDDDDWDADWVVD